MEFKELGIAGLFEITNFVARDNRGIFVKTFHEADFKTIGFENQFAESYYSQSVKNVIRGMHFQTPPYDHEKLVYVTEGKITDVIVDLRKASSTFGKYINIQLEAFSNSVFIPKGCAHGFLTVSEMATVVYNVTTVYNPNHDTGIRWNSFGFNWIINNPIIAKRDQEFISFEEFKSPF